MDILTVTVAFMLLSSSVWVLGDASSLGVRKGCLNGGFFDIGPVGWFISTLLLWCVAFPGYLVTRPKYKQLHAEKRREEAMATSGAFAGDVMRPLYGRHQGPSAL
jgi:hypothetical protein